MTLGQWITKKSVILTPNDVNLLFLEFNKMRTGIIFYHSFGHNHNHHLLDHSTRNFCIYFCRGLSYSAWVGIGRILHVHGGVGHGAVTHAIRVGSQLQIYCWLYCRSVRVSTPLVAGRINPIDTPSKTE